MKNIILSVLSVVVLLVGAALIVPSFIDWSHYKDQIKAQVEKSTGYQLDLNGPLKAAFLPTPHVNIEDIAIDSAGAKGPYGFKGSVSRASVSIALLPLLSGEVAVSEIALIDPVIDVQEQKFEAVKSDENDVTTSNAQDNSQNQTPTVQINNLVLQNAKISYKPLKGDAQSVEIPSLAMEADSLMGPFEFDGAVVYNNARYDFKGSSGEYQTQEPFPVTVNIKSAGYAVSYSGIADMTRDDVAVQGEVNVQLDDPRALNIPIKDPISLGGLLSATSQMAKIDNGTFAVGDTMGRLKLNASDLDADTKDIQASIDLSSALNLDALLTDIEQKKSTEAGDSTNDKSSKKQPAYDFLPETIEIPGGLKAQITLSVPSIIYKDQNVKDVSIDGNLNQGKVNAAFSVKELPDSGNISMSAALTGESVSRNGTAGSYVLANPSLSFDGNVNLKSLKSLTSDWLGMADAKTFDNEAVPQNAKGTIKGTIKGSRAEVSFPTLSASDYTIKNAKAVYKNASKPTFNLSVSDVNGAAVSLSGVVGETKNFKANIRHTNAKKAIQIVKKDFASDSPALQKPLSFEADIAMGDADIAVTNMVAALGSVKTKGTINVATGGAKPSIKAALAFDTLDTQSLLTGEASSAGKSSGTGSASSSPKNNSSPWTRDALDTSFLRSMNVDLKATAKQLVHGTWGVDQAVVDVDLKNGVLSMNDISGKLFGGDMSLKGQASAVAEGQPLDVNTTISAQSVNLNKLVKAITAQTKDRVIGTGSFDMALNARGLSSSALVNSLNGDGTLKTSALTVKGLSLAKISEAISDESLSDLADVVRGAFNDGQTQFNAIDEILLIREGNMLINDFRLENDTASIASNGEVNFARWFMDVESNVAITQPEKLPEIAMTIKGPLNAPQKNVTNDILISFIKNKYGAKIQKKLDKVLGDKLKNSPVGGLINNLLGTPQTGTSEQVEPAVNDNAVPPQEKTSPEKELLKNLFNKF